MLSVDQIESTVRHLSPEDLASFRQWFAKFEAEHWDKQIADDFDSGRLDAEIEEARKDAREGRCTDL